MPLGVYAGPHRLEKPGVAGLMCAPMPGKHKEARRSTMLCSPSPASRFLRGWPVVTGQVPVTCHRGLRYDCGLRGQTGARAGVDFSQGSKNSTRDNRQLIPQPLPIRSWCRIVANPLLSCNPRTSPRSAPFHVNPRPRQLFARIQNISFPPPHHGNHFFHW